MKRGAPLKRRSPLVRGGSLRRTPLRAARSKRDWGAALEKVRQEGRCRTCGRSGVKLDAAHVIARSQVVAGPGEHADNIVPLCAGAEGCHRKYDGHALELLPFLTLSEQSYIAGLVGIARAYRITTHRDKASLAAAGVNDTEGELDG